MGFISRLFFGKKDKNKHEDTSHDVNDDEFVMEPSRKIGRENPIHDPTVTVVSHNPSEHKKAKKKLSSKYFGKNILDENTTSQESQEAVIPPPPPPSSSSSQQRSRTNSNSNNATGESNHRIKQDSLHIPSQNFPLKSSSPSSPSPMTITMMSPPPKEDYENQENQQPTHQTHKPFIPSTNIPMVASPEVFQARGKLRNTPKRPSAMTFDSTSFTPQQSQQQQTAPLPSQQPIRPELKPASRHQQTPLEPPIQRVALKPTKPATTNIQSQSQPSQPPQPQQPVWGRSLLKQTSQADRLYGSSGPLPPRGSPTQPQSSATIDEETAHREQVREATRALRQNATQQQQQLAQPPIQLEIRHRSSPTPLVPEVQDDEISISTFGSGKGGQGTVPSLPHFLPSPRPHQIVGPGHPHHQHHNPHQHQHPRPERIRPPSGDGQSTSISTISGDSGPPAPHHHKGHGHAQNATELNRKTSTQLKLPVSLSRSATTATTTRVKNDEKNLHSARRAESPGPVEIQQHQQQQQQQSQQQQRLMKKQSSEMRIPSSEPKDSQTLVNSPRTNTTTPTATIRKQLNSENNPKSSQSERERVRKEREMKMREREERQEREEREREEREREEKYQKYLNDEHTRWKIKEKEYEVIENNKLKRIKRSLSERLFLNVGEKSEIKLSSEEEEREAEEERRVNSEEFKVIQGTLAAELIELIEKSRLSRLNESGGSAAAPVTGTLQPSKLKDTQQGPDKSDDNSSFDEDEYFREIAALSLETSDEDFIHLTNGKTGKGILDNVHRLPNSVQNSSLSKEVAKTIAKAKRIEEKKAAAQNIINEKKVDEQEPSTAVTSLLSNMVPLRIGRDAEWRQHEASIQSTRRASASREQNTASGIDRMKELIQEEEREAEGPIPLPVTAPSSPTPTTRARSMSCSRLSKKSNQFETTRGKKIKEMTNRERLWARAAGSLGGVSFSSADPVLQELKLSAESLGETLMEKQFGQYRFIDEWEGIEIFKKSKKNRQNLQQTISTSNTTLTPQHVPFSSSSHRNRSSSAADLSSTRRGSGPETRLSLL